MSEVALQAILGIVFAILGIALVVRTKSLTNSKYFKLLFIIVGIIMIGFAIYLAFEGLYPNE